MKRFFTKAITVVTVLLPLAFVILPGCDLGGETAKTHIITFDTAAEQTTESSKPTYSMKLNMYAGELLEELPEPYYSGYQFRGWYDRAEEGDLFEPPWEVNRDLALYAYWGNGADPSKDYRVVFNPNGGTINGSGEIFTVNVKRPPWTISNMPFPASGNNAFGGWFTEMPGGTPDYAKELGNTTPVTGLNLSENGAQSYAYWYSGPQEFAVTFNANGGGWGPAELRKEVKINAPAATTLEEAGSWPETPAMADFPLEGWFTADNVAFDKDTRITRDKEVFAKWTYSAIDTITYGVNEDGEFVGTIPNGGIIRPIDNTGTSTGTINAYRVLEFPANTTTGTLDIGQMGGSYLAENEWTIELYINLGDTVAAGAAKAIRFYGTGAENDGAFWMEGHGLWIYRPNTGDRPDFGLSSTGSRNRWYHMAIARNGGALKTYLNGEFMQDRNCPAFSNAAFKSVTHCLFTTALNNAKLYQITFTKGIKTEADFAGVSAIVNALNGE
ncbi:MAG: InlB B-repeat-containing protein [Treponema sp.]|jgi:hypothetical protein|nr:InlB B-repeat-containing protein [Treponema sp.]